MLNPVILRVRVLPALGLALLSGCGYGDRGRTDVFVPEDPVLADIDTDAVMEGFVPGEQAGAFVEYSAGGLWYVYSICDVRISGAPCYWDIVVRPVASGTLFDLVRDRLEPDDWLDWWWDPDYGVWTARMVAVTEDGIDGMFVRSDPGAPVQIDVLLDEAPAPDLLRWVSRDAVNPGSPANPVQLTPTSP